jgi:hypothetical protein
MTRRRIEGFGELDVEQIGDRRWRLNKDWVTPYLTVPAGFETDGVSAGILRPFARPSGSFFEAAILHDWMYVNAIQTKAAADHAFYVVARLYGVNKVRAYAAYQLCVLIGRGAYSAVR